VKESLIKLLSGFIALLILAIIWKLDDAVAITILWIFFSPLIVSLLSGLIRGILFRKWDTLHFAIEIFRGNFIYEEGKQPADAILTILSRLYWQQPQTLMGNVAMHVLNSVWLIRKTDRYRDILVLQGSFLNGGGIALGSFIMIDLLNAPVVEVMPIDDRSNAVRILIRHEYGHYLQSIVSGPLYIFKYGLPSIITQGWTETDADFRSDKDLLLKEQIMPVFSNHRNLSKPVNPHWWEFLIIVITGTAGGWLNQFHGAFGGLIIGSVIITALNMKKPA